MDEVIEIIRNLKKGIIHPVYFLMGDEPYYIDIISDYIESSILTEEERGFNQMTLYGLDVSIEDVVSNAKRFPMMAEHQVIIVKEAQALSRNIEKLKDYAENPQPSTALVICYKGKTLDKRKALYKALKKTGVVYTSKKVPDYKLADWIHRALTSKGYSIEPKAVQMLADFLGNDLGRVSQELEKLKVIISKEQQITAALVEKNIGISKDFNNFELREAIGERNKVKAHQIVNYFGENPKAHPMVVTVAMIYSFFSQLLQYHGLQDKSKGSVASALRINPFFVKDYALAARNYPMKRISQIISLLRETDLKGKGLGATNIGQGQLLKELLIKIMD
ncbi:DNA polymerase III subunit delta [Gangjinia marincola]|uniref:DNA polymerase III subunit delta n=1 Tax=Gangjinia marincola TaxID=578463 RepID=A0ABN1MGE9_9FLAO